MLVRVTLIRICPGSMSGRLTVSIWNGLPGASNRAIRPVNTESSSFQWLVDSRLNRSLRTRLSSLPLGFFGSESTKKKCLGGLKPALRLDWRHHSGSLYQVHTDEMNLAADGTNAATGSSVMK